MIAFSRRPLWKRLLRLIPAVRKRQDRELEAAIQLLVENPDMPCAIEGRIIPNGYGGRTL